MILLINVPPLDKHRYFFESAYFRYYHKKYELNSAFIVFSFPLLTKRNTDTLFSRETKKPNQPAGSLFD